MTSQPFNVATKFTKKLKLSFPTWSSFICDWMVRDLGGPTPECLKKAQEEFVEMEQAIAEGKSPWDIAVEAADVIICLVGFLGSMGYDACAVVGWKMEVNKRRKWSRREDGTYQHKEE